jgi:hypothetical protein
MCSYVGLWLILLLKNKVYNVNHSVVKLLALSSVKTMFYTKETKEEWLDLRWSDKPVICWMQALLFENYSCESLFLKDMVWKQFRTVVIQEILSRFSEIAWGGHVLAVWLIKFLDFCLFTKIAYEMSCFILSWKLRMDHFKWLGSSKIRLVAVVQLFIFMTRYKGL